MSHVVALLVGLSILPVSIAAAEPAVDPATLQGYPPKSPSEAVDSFKVRPGLKIELVASEPDVVDPIAIAFDERNRMFAVEMRDYSERAGERLGRIRLLEDTNGDGRMDRSFVFAEGLPWPTGVFPYRGGVLVICTPDLLYLKDTDGDGRADTREVVLTGLGVQVSPLNVQQLANSLSWSVDNRIHATTGGNGALLKNLRHPQDPVLNLRTHDFSIDPRSFKTEKETGGGQYGICFDDVGRKFICNNSSHVRQVILENDYLSDTTRLSFPDLAPAIAVDGAAAPVFRLSPEEPWRVLRTQWRVSGMVPGPIEGGGRSSGYFTSASGICVYRGNALGEDFAGDVFVADVGSNLVHRKKLRKLGVQFAAERPQDEQGTEFLASKDNWFRPAQIANGPDGALYIVDIYRQTIEHPWSIPASIKTNIDLNRGNDRGRIYRVVPKEFTQPRLPRLDQMDTPALVKQLESPNGWTRDTASRLLLEKNSSGSAALLKEFFEATSSPMALIHAAYLLADLGKADARLVLSMISNPREEVRLHGLRLLERAFPKGAVPPEIRQRLETLAQSNASPELLFQLTCTLTKLPGLDPWPIVVKMRSEDRWVRLGTKLVLEKSLKNKAQLEAASDQLLQDYLEVAALNRAKDALSHGLAMLEKRAQSQPQRALQTFALLTTMLGNQDSLRSALESLSSYQQLRNDSFKKLSERSFASAEDLNFLVLAASSQAPGTEDLLLKQLQTAAPPQVQEVALNALLERPTARPQLLSRWRELTPRMQAVAVEYWLRNPSGRSAILEALKSEKMLARELTAAQKMTLRQSLSGADLASLEALLSGGTIEERKNPASLAQRISQLTPKAEEGRKIYLERCSSCHRFRGEGQLMGPDLESIKANGAEYLLTHLLDPNREVAPRYVVYRLTLKNGDELDGFLAEDSPAAIGVRSASGQFTRVDRTDVRQLQSLGVSLMPEALEEGLSDQQLADLVGYILQQ